MMAKMELMGKPKVGTGMVGAGTFKEQMMSALLPSAEGEKDGNVEEGCTCRSLTLPTLWTLP
jgi:hypothetical protein